MPKWWSTFLVNQLTTASWMRLQARRRGPVWCHDTQGRSHRSPLDAGPRDGLSSRWVVDFDLVRRIAIFATQTIAVAGEEFGNQCLGIPGAEAGSGRRKRCNEKQGAGGIGWRER